MCDFVNPDVLGDLKTFQRVFENPILQSRDPTASQDAIRLGKERMDELAKRTSQFILRRTADVNKKYLPPKRTF
jgi:DNA repair and recombination protein RAD54B